MRIPETWRAGLVRRWHTNAYLQATDDSVAAHSFRVMALAMLLKPDLSRAALVFAMKHDLGEIATGDIPYPVKQGLPSEIASALERIEEDAADRLLPDGAPGPFPPEEFRLVLACDRLDSALWARLHIGVPMPGEERRAWGKMEHDALAMVEAVVGRARMEQVFGEGVYVPA